jgi:ribosomal protein S18 acetylase RimI-like enzyme
VGVHPEFRRKGIGAALYQQFFSVVSALGCNVVRCVTSSVNRDSVAFHLRIGFTVEPTEASVDGLYIARDYDGRGEDRVLFVRRLGA